MGIITQGHHFDFAFVTSFSLAYSEDGKRYTYLKNKLGNVQVCKSNLIFLKILNILILDI